MVIKNFDEILSEVNAVDESTAGYKAITIWVPGEYKGKFDEIQKRTSRKFSRKAREILMVAIDRVHKAS